MTQPSNRDFSQQSIFAELENYGRHGFANALFAQQKLDVDISIVRLSDAIARPADITRSCSELVVRILAERRTIHR